MSARSASLEARAIRASRFFIVFLAIGSVLFWSEEARRASLYPRRRGLGSWHATSTLAERELIAKEADWPIVMPQDSVSRFSSRSPTPSVPSPLVSPSSPPPPPPPQSPPRSSTFLSPPPVPLPPGFQCAQSTPGPPSRPPSCTGVPGSGPSCTPTSVLRRWHVTTQELLILHLRRIWSDRKPRVMVDLGSHAGHGVGRNFSDALLWCACQLRATYKTTSLTRAFLGHTNTTAYRRFRAVVLARTSA